MMRIVFDCTELYRNPIRTGIQRVVRELLRHWPQDGPELHPARFDPALGLVGLPQDAVALLLETEPETKSMCVEEVQSRLEFLRQYAGPILPSDALVFIPEIFYDPARCRFHEQRLATFPRSLAMLAYDFIPYLQPSIFRFATALPYMYYLHLLSRAPSVAFISEHTRTDFATRVLRVPPDDLRLGPVLTPGADGLPVERQTWRSDRRTFVCVGSLDGRKNQDVVTEGFVRLWNAGHDFKLLLIGRAFDEQNVEWLDRAREFPQFRWLDTASDPDIEAAFRGARATIFLSTAEGFGLPPVESLRAGVPVITLPDVPSIAMIPPLGQIRLSHLSAEAIAAAVIRMADDRFAQQLWSEATGQELQTWRMFAHHSARWCAGL